MTRTLDAAIARLAALSPRKTMIDNCGHIPQLDKAEEFYRLVRDFLIPTKSTN